MITITKVNMIDVGDWDELVESTYGRPYSFQQQDNCKERGTENLTVPCHAYDYDWDDDVVDKINGDEMGVSFAAWLARDPKEWNGDAKDKRFIRMFWERNFYPCVDMIANDLHAKGLLPAGEYVINIDW